MHACRCIPDARAAVQSVAGKHNDAKLRLRSTAGGPELFSTCARQTLAALLSPSSASPLAPLVMLSAARLSSLRSARPSALRSLQALSVSARRGRPPTSAGPRELTPARSCSPLPSSRRASTRPRSRAPSCELPAPERAARRRRFDPQEADPLTSPCVRSLVLTHSGIDLGTTNSVRPLSFAHTARGPAR